ncbi:GNAT family N-acetyltransferase [Nocardia seriolae]|nr:GNAT family N-acetyltransferase [Nocardia seriolae]
MRELTDADWPLWRRLRLAALAEAPHAFKSSLADWHNGAEQRWRIRFEDPTTHNVAVLIDHQPVGMASGVPAEGSVVELRSLWVSPPARGQGVAPMIVAAIETWARSRHATTLRLSVLPGNRTAIALYDQLGFGLVAAVADGSTSELVMQKRLD